MRNQVFIYGIYTIIVVSNLSCSHNQRTDKNNVSTLEDSLYLKNVPAQPGEENWKFIDDLKSPMWTKHPWVKAQPGPQEADLSEGVNFQMGFPDPNGRLETAYDDLHSFLSAGGVQSINGEYTIEIAVAPNLKAEDFHLEIEPKVCHILAGDVEGIRRGIFHLEDEMLRLRGPFLPLGKIEKHPFVQRRISRCVYGPIK